MEIWVGPFEVVKIEPIPLYSIKSLVSPQIFTRVNPTLMKKFFGQLPKVIGRVELIFKDLSLVNIKGKII